MCDLDDETALYVRGDDMPNFPAKPFVETIMLICLLHYTYGVSSTQIRMNIDIHHVAGSHFRHNELWHVILVYTTCLIPISDIKICYM